MTLPPLIEYLLGVRGAGGGPLARLGVIQTTVPVFPPAMTVTYMTYPVFGSYISIEFFYRVSPVMTPGAFNFDISHAGASIQSGAVGALALAEGWNVWLEVTQGQPIRNIVTNISGLNQFLETLDFFLVISTEADYKEVKQLIQLWGGNPPPTAPEAARAAVAAAAARAGLPRCP